MRLIIDIRHPFKTFFVMLSEADTLKCLQCGGSMLKIPKDIEVIDEHIKEFYHPDGFRWILALAQAFLQMDAYNQTTMLCNGTCIEFRRQS